LVVIIAKAPQKRGIVNYGLSICYDASTNFSTGLLHGNDVLAMSTTYVTPEERQQSKLADIKELLKNSMHLCTHPLLISCAILISHYHRADHFCVLNCSRSVMSVEAELGVTKAGRQIEDDEAGQPDSLSKPKIRDLTSKINTLLTTVLFTARSPEWNLQFSTLLLQLLRDIPQYRGSTEKMNAELREIIEHYKTLDEGLIHHVNGLKYRLEVQLNVVSTLPHS
jgi:hypothetical protein